VVVKNILTLPAAVYVKTGHVSPSTNQAEQVITLTSADGGVADTG
jgi:hypothetical protein